MSTGRRRDGDRTSGARRLGRMAWPDVPTPGALLVIPAGSTEQHGPHLPIATDTIVAEELALRLGSALAYAVVAPPLPYGSSGEHAGFPGTLSIGQAALETVVVELVRSADAFAATVIVSGHGGNAEALARAARRLEAEGRPVLVWSPREQALAGPLDAHAGAVETSIMLFLRPELVGPVDPRTEPVTTSIGELLPRLRREGLRSVSRNGVLGDPGGASPERGLNLIEALATDLRSCVESWWASLAAGRPGPHPAGSESK